jgi:hypothetical protein
VIVYNVGRRWFTMKNDAEAHRRAEGLPPAATFKLDIRDREDLAVLLNGLCGLGTGSLGAVVLDPPREVIQRNLITVPECIPQFLVNEWAKREGINPDTIERVP